MNKQQNHLPINIDNQNGWEVTMNTEFYECELKRLETVAKKIELNQRQQFDSISQRVKYDVERIQCLTGLLTSTVQEENGPLFGEGKQRPVFNEDECKAIRARILDIALRM